MIDQDFYEDAVSNHADIDTQFMIDEDYDGSFQWFDDDVCCYDPRYKGPPNYCACAVYQEQIALEQTIHYRVRSFILSKCQSIRLKVLCFLNKFRPSPHQTNVDVHDDLPF